VLAGAGDTDAVHRLDASIDEELAKIRPEFEADLVAHRAELSGEAFAALRKSGFAEEVELLLTDTAKAVLDQRILRDLDRFEDDLQRGVWDATAQKPMAAKRRGWQIGRGESGGRGRSATASGKLCAETIRQKHSSRFEETGLCRRR